VDFYDTSTSDFVPPKMPLSIADKFGLVSTTLSMVACFVGFASPEWIVRVTSDIKWIPLHSMGLWSMNVDDFQVAGDDRVWDGNYWIWTFWRYNNLDSTTYQYFVCLQTISFIGFLVLAIGNVWFIFALTSAFCNGNGYRVVATLLHLTGGSLFLVGVSMYYCFDYEMDSFLWRWLGPTYVSRVKFGWGFGFAFFGSIMAVLTGLCLLFLACWRRRALLPARGMSDTLSFQSLAEKIDG